MYGLRLQDVIPQIRTEEKILVVVGAEKVPGDMYELADYNVAVANQPHSEISALALFLDHLYEGAELELTFPDENWKCCRPRLARQPSSTMNTTVTKRESVGTGCRIHNPSRGKVCGAGRI
jgi:predicted SpoU family rRNA methylase